MNKVAEKLLDASLDFPIILSNPADIFKQGGIEINRLEFENRLLKKAIKQTIEELSIMDESQGVAGWHLNGAVATWEEVGLTDIREELMKLLEE